MGFAGNVVDPESCYCGTWCPRLSHGKSRVGIGFRAELDGIHVDGVTFTIVILLVARTADLVISSRYCDCVCGSWFDHFAWRSISYIADHPDRDGLSCHAGD